MKKGLFAALLMLFAMRIGILSAADQTLKPITSFLNSKAYHGADKSYENADLVLSPEVDRALAIYGVSGYALLRNEIYARHGYIFKNPALSTIFSSAKWYKADTSVGINAVIGIEAKNVDFIKKIEDEYDYDVIASFISFHRYSRRTIYSSDAELNVPPAVELAMNHLSLNPSRVFKNEIFARNGYSFRTPSLKKVFSKVSWYEDRNLDEKNAMALFSYEEYVNLELLRGREWIEMLDSVKYSMPENITVIPTVGMNALFLKEVHIGGETYHFSNSSAWLSIEETGKNIGAHSTNTDELVSPSVIEKIRQEKDPRRRIAMYFSNKKYAGYADTMYFNHSDMKVPSYLAEAVQTLRIDWRLLLRKEIHARHSAVFIDPNAGPIFRACPWYKPVYNLTSATRSRFPEKVRLSDAELSNYSMLEGEELSDLYSANGNQNVRTAIDLQGHLYFIKAEKISLFGSKNTLTVGYGFSSAAEAASESVEVILRNKVVEIEKKLDAIREEEYQKEARYQNVGC